MKHGRAAAWWHAHHARGRTVLCPVCGLSARAWAVVAICVGLSCAPAVALVVILLIVDAAR